MIYVTIPNISYRMFVEFANRYPALIKTSYRIYVFTRLDIDKSDWLSEYCVDYMEWNYDQE